ncbi:unnamed protein product [Choristocarpus tenellus]
MARTLGAFFLALVLEAESVSIESPCRSNLLSNPTLHHNKIEGSAWRFGRKYHASTRRFWGYLRGTGADDLNAEDCSPLGESSDLVKSGSFKADRSSIDKSSDLTEEESTRWLHKPRLYLESGGLWPGRTAQLSQSQAQYLVSVLRLRNGDFVRVFDGTSGEFLASIQGVGGGQGPRRNNRAASRGASLRIERLLRPQPITGTDPPSAELFFAPIRKVRVKQLVEKAVEVGVSGLSLVHTARTQSSTPDVGVLSKLQPTVIEAAEQCERLTLPFIDTTPIALALLLERWGKEVIETPQGPVVQTREQRVMPLFVCKERGLDAPPLLQALADAAASDIFRSSDVSRWGAAAFLVGPEGGFDLQELELMARYPFVRFVSLGPTVLRAETAGIYALSCWSAFWANMLPSTGL